MADSAAATPGGSSFLKGRAEGRPNRRPLGHANIPYWPLGLKAALGLVDALAISGAVLVSLLFAFGTEVDTPVAGAGHMLSQQLAAVLFGGVWMIFLAASESRRPRYLGAGLEEYRRVIVSTLQAFGTLAILSYLLKFGVSRLVFVTLLPVGLIFVLWGRWAARRVLTIARERGRLLTPTVVVGDEHEVSITVRDLKRNSGAGYQPVAVCISQGKASYARAHFEGHRLVPQSELVSFLSRFPNAAVVVAGGLSRGATRQLAWELETSPVELFFVPRLLDVAGPRMSIHDADGVDLVRVELPKYSGAKFFLKRSFDIVVALAALIVLAPALLIIALIVKLDDGGPILFRQERIGLDGQPFIMHKFRTMVVDAEDRMAQLITDSGGSALLFKLKDDPRITRAGKYLRKYSLDELPQFWTVLLGPMSIVGPRPQVAREVAEYSGGAHRRLFIKPGITGLWQVSGRSELTPEEAIRLDLRYVENWSLAGDLSIILKTAKVVLFPRGAY